MKKKPFVTLEKLQEMTEKTEGKTAYEENKNYLYYGTSIQ